jgi:uncharacterized protein YjbI with pentapeptide repeats
MKVIHFAALALIPTVLISGPALGEDPLDEVRLMNVRQLLVTNRCDYCDLAGVDLSGAHLIGADLRGAHLQGADLSWANLEGADLDKADLQGANLTGAFLTNASMVYANLDDVNFAEAHLYFVDVTGASMSNLNLANADIFGTAISIGEDDATHDSEEGIPIQVVPFEEVTQPQP